MPRSSHPDGLPGRPTLCQRFIEAVHIKCRRRTTPVVALKTYLRVDRFNGGESEF
jgi:hypothetical protein